MKLSRRICRLQPTPPLDPGFNRGRQLGEESLPGVRCSANGVLYQRQEAVGLDVPLRQTASLITALQPLLLLFAAASTLGFAARSLDLIAARLGLAASGSCFAASRTRNTAIVLSYLGRVAASGAFLAACSPFFTARLGFAASGPFDTAGRTRIATIVRRLSGSVDAGQQGAYSEDRANNQFRKHESTPKE
jgi:hypothetical protein